MLGRERAIDHGRGAREFVTGCREEQAGAADSLADARVAAVAEAREKVHARVSILIDAA
jgi:hypothetical protein